MNYKSPQGTLACKSGEEEEEETQKWRGEKRGNRDWRQIRGTL